MTHWLWTNRSPPARLSRLLLIPPSLLFRVTTAARARAYRSGWLPRHALPVPSVAIGNLAVGGAGKTPCASWVAAYFARHGVRPGILLRGFGGDEGAVHRRAVPGAVVVEHPDRVGAARQAVTQGARVLVLDDAFQRLDVRRDLNLVLVSAESTHHAQWTLPAGPWRESWRALRRADIVVVTAKTATSEAIEQVTQRIVNIHGRAPALARLEITGFRRLRSSLTEPLEMVGGTKLLASAGVADPGAFADQLRGLSGQVELMGWTDHHRYNRADVTRILCAGGKLDYVVVTEKDASKLETLWPANATEPLVAQLAVRWDRGRSDVESALSRLIEPCS